MRSGFCTIVGRPNAGKSTLLNGVLGRKVSIVSDKPQTTRTPVRGVLTRDDVQVVFVDTPGLHKPRTALGERLNESASDAIGDVDVVVLVVDATKPIGGGDEWVAERVPAARTLVALNKVDKASRAQIAAQLAAAATWGCDEYFPISARTGDGVDALVAAITARMPEGPMLYPPDVVSDLPEAIWLAELVREQLLAIVHDELPHSIFTRVTEWEWPRVRCEILVERESQKGIVIGRGGENLKRVGIAVREQIDPHVYLELFVKVDRDWQRRPERVDRLLRYDP